MVEYYRFISRIVTVYGSNQKEQFLITKNDDGSVNVVVNKLNKDSVVTGKMYERTFLPSITKELRIFGLNDDDIFIVQGGSTPIKIRVIGGSGNDEFINKGNDGRVRIYDASFEKNQISGHFKKNI